MITDSPTKVTGVTASLAEIKEGKAGTLVLSTGSIVSTTGKATFVEMNDLGGMSHPCVLGIITNRQTEADYHTGGQRYQGASDMLAKQGGRCNVQRRYDREGVDAYQRQSGTN